MEVGNLAKKSLTALTHSPIFALKNFLIKTYLLFACLTGVAQVSTSGCTISGAMSVYSPCNNGQGCEAGCNLTAFSAFGPMCNGTGFTGNCFNSSGGHQIVTTSVTLPSGCTANITAEFKPRAGCPSAGVDSGDSLLIKGYGGTSSSPNPNAGGGASNASVVLTFTQSSGSFVIRLRANRSDEIATFTINYSGSCGPSCNQVLPIDLINFWGRKEKNNSIALNWQVKQQEYLKSYLIERSSNGQDFILLSEIPAQMVKQTNFFVYQYYDENPIDGVNYYRLTNVDIDGKSKSHPIIAINNAKNNSNWWHMESTNEITIHWEQAGVLSEEFLMMDMSGRVIRKINPSQNSFTFLKSEFPSGIYYMKDPSGQIPSYKIVLIN